MCPLCLCGHYGVQSTKKAPSYRAFSNGEGGIRTRGTRRHTGFRDRPIQPLWHLSTCSTNHAVYAMSRCISTVFTFVARRCILLSFDAVIHPREFRTTWPSVAPDSRADLRDRLSTIGTRLGTIRVRLGTIGDDSDTFGNVWGRFFEPPEIVNIEFADGCHFRPLFFWCREIPLVGIEGLTHNP